MGALAAKNGDVGVRPEGSGGLSLVMEVSYPVKGAFIYEVTLDYEICSEIASLKI
jgi:hypothetical protein